jgi:hypothetical protein
MRLLILAIFFSGCAKHQPKAWVSVEKPPIRVIYLDYDKDISANTVHCLVEQVKDTKFHGTPFNPSTEIKVSTDYDETYEYNHSIQINKE